jgi:polysaccharide biosynthesis protein PslG
MSRRGFAVACVALAASLAAPAVAQAVTPNPFYGVVGTYFPAQADLDRVANAGGGVFRVQVDPSFTAPSPGARDYYGTDVLFGEAAKAGITILPDLLSVPRWMSRNPSRPPVSTAVRRNAWRALLTDYAARYGSNGTLWAEHPELPRRPVTTWEIWNEPNLGGSVGGKPSPRRFVRLLRISSEALRAGDPNARVLAGGLFPYRQPNGMTLVRYLNAMYRIPGASSSFDAIGVHPYAAKPRGVLRWVRVTRRITRSHGDGAKPIWVSAFGWVTGGAGYRYSPLRATFRQQAAKLTRTYALLGRNAGSLGIASAIWFTYTDAHRSKRQRVTRRDFITDRMGLFTIKLRPKPSWFAFARSAGGTP